uniref:Uncharacterized protein n=1 Tax=Oryzias melastigma TaxID=30732 RepID=A0A3B3BII1_ORYME
QREGLGMTRENPNMVRFSNFSSPEYIMELKGHKHYSWLRCPGSRVEYLPKRPGLLSPCRPRCGATTLNGHFSSVTSVSPFLDIFSVAHHQKRSTLREPLWLPLATSPS